MDRHKYWGELPAFHDLMGDPETLLKLLAFDPFAILIMNEWWRVASCALVHADVLHVGANLIGLMILGPFLAQRMGAMPFFLLFVFSVVFASLFSLALMWFSVIEPAPMIGASGGVMGIVGGYLGYYGLSFLRSGSLYHKEQLRGVIFIVCLQTAFDVLTPRVSFTAHFGGMLAGFLCYLLINLISGKLKEPTSAP